SRHSFTLYTTNSNTIFQVYPNNNKTATMQFTLALATLIAAVSAAPGNDRAVTRNLSGMTYGEVKQYCGANQEISCCNQKKTASDNGLLNGVLSQGLVGQCSKLNVAAAAGLTDNLNLDQNHCKGGSVACCQSADKSADQTVGLINLALPCIAIGSLL
ncbi:hydrophobin family protein, partial [Salmonella enterica subsp. enterica serovar Paratyphi A]